jgi:hypothetical protein
MKFLTFAFVLIFTSNLIAGPGEIDDINSSKIGVGIENNGKELVMIFQDQFENNLHTVIDLNRVDDIEYKTRVMRYFGGMLKNNTYKFEKIVVIKDNEEIEMEFTRENMSDIVNSMCNKLN